MRVLLVRHARAGKRIAWVGDDRLRPLDRKGRRQAEALTERLAEYGVDQLLSSPYVRCVQTLEPLAERLGLPIEVRDELAEGSTSSAVLGLLSNLDATTPALSTHGDVVEALIGEPSPKGSVWVVEFAQGEIRRAGYLPPPD